MIVLLTAAALAAAAQSATEPSRIIVEGWGSVENAPDIARISYHVRGEGTTSDQAVADLVKKTANVTNALRSIDSAIDLKSNSVSIEGVRAKGCSESEYEAGFQLSAGACGIKGYIAMQDFDLETRRVGDAGTIVGLAGRHGAFNPRVSGFDLADSKDAKRRAIASAIAEAKSKAEAVAAGSGARLGQVLSVSLDNARNVADDLMSLPGLATRHANAERDEPIAVNLTPKPVETSARVSVIYAIVR